MNVSNDIARLLFQQVPFFRMINSFVAQVTTQIKEL